MKFDQSLDFLHRYLTRLWNAAGHSDRANTLSYNEYAYLRSVEKLDGEKVPNSPGHHPGTHFSELATELQVQKASVSAMVNKLEKRGLIRRLPCQYDARAQHIMLTDEGRSAFHAQQEIYHRMAGKIKALLDREEYRQLEQVLSRVCQGL